MADNKLISIQVTAKTVNASSNHIIPGVELSFQVFNADGEFDYEDKGVTNDQGHRANIVSESLRRCFFKDLSFFTSCFG